MPIFPVEIINITNKSPEECVDPDCINCILNKNYKKKKALFNWDDTSKLNGGVLNFEINMNNHICEKCDMKIQKKKCNIFYSIYEY